jgi:ribosomal protein L37AE/L43A
VTGAIRPLSERREGMMTCPGCGREVHSAVRENGVWHCRYPDFLDALHAEEARLGAELIELREIVRDLAKTDPKEPPCACQAQAFTLVSTKSGTERDYQIDHYPGCLWSRAQKYKGGLLDGKEHRETP